MSVPEFKSQLPLTQTDQRPRSAPFSGCRRKSGMSMSSTDWAVSRAASCMRRRWHDSAGIQPRCPTHRTFQGPCAGTIGSCGRYTVLRITQQALTSAVTGVRRLCARPVRCIVRPRVHFDGHRISLQWQIDVGDHFFFSHTRADVHVMKEHREIAERLTTLR